MSDAENEKNPLDDMTLVEVYAAGSHIGVDRIVMMLEDEGIEALAREITVAEFPAAASERFLVTVPTTEKERSANIIKQAITDGVLPGDTGTFL